MVFVPSESQLVSMDMNWGTQLKMMIYYFESISYSLYKKLKWSYALNSQQNRDESHKTDKLSFVYLWFYKGDILCCIPRKILKWSGNVRPSGCRNYNRIRFAKALQLLYKLIFEILSLLCENSKNTF